MSLSSLGKRRPALAGKKNDTKIINLPVVLRGSSDGSYGAWYQLLSAAAYDTYVTRLATVPAAVSVAGSPSNMYGLVKLGIGAAGSEVEKAEIAVVGALYWSGAGTIFQGTADINPWFAITAGTRLVAKLSVFGAEVQHTVHFSLIQAQYLDET